MTRESIFDNPQSIGERSRQLAQEEGRGCQRCGTTVGKIEHKHRNTSYDYPAIAISIMPDAQEGDKNDPNYATLCSACWKEDDEYWEEMWREYWGGRL